MTTKLFGEPVQRVEDAKLVTGTAHFLDDIGHDALGVAFVRSPHAHARVVDIDIPHPRDLSDPRYIRLRDEIFGAYGEVQRMIRTERWKFIHYPKIDHPASRYRSGHDRSGDVERHRRSV